jgi:elongation factor 1-gamma
VAPAASAAPASAASAAAPAAPAKADKKKKEPAAAKPEKRKQEEAAVPDPFAAEVKPKNPLDALPKSEFVLDAWKREYSNAPGGDTNLAMPYFWENLDLVGAKYISSPCFGVA